MQVQKYFHPKANSQEPPADNRVFFFAFIDNRELRIDNSRGFRHNRQYHSHPCAACITLTIVEIFNLHLRLRVLLVQKFDTLRADGKAFRIVPLICTDPGCLVLHGFRSPNTIILNNDLQISICKLMNIYRELPVVIAMAQTMPDRVLI